MYSFPIQKIQSVEKTAFRFKTYSTRRNNVAEKLSIYAELYKMKRQNHLKRQRSDFKTVSVALNNAAKTYLAMPSFTRNFEKKPLLFKTQPYRWCNS
jgi:hypothetical protein